MGYRHGWEVTLSRIICWAVLFGNVVLDVMIARARRWFRGATLRDVDDESFFDGLSTGKVFI